jgi:hypothetical protein
LETTTLAVLKSLTPTPEQVVLPTVAFIPTLSKLPEFMNQHNLLLLVTEHDLCACFKDLWPIFWGNGVIWHNLAKIDV